MGYTGQKGKKGKKGQKDTQQGDVPEFLLHNSPRLSGHMPSLRPSRELSEQDMKCRQDHLAACVAKTSRSSAVRSSSATVMPPPSGPPIVQRLKVLKPQTQFIC